MRTRSKIEPVEGQWGLPEIGIPSEVLFHPDLNQTEKLLFGFIRNLAQTSLGCWASNNFLGELIGCTPETIRKSIRNLEQLGFLSVIYEELENKNTQRRIFIDNHFYAKYRKYAVAGNNKLKISRKKSNHHPPPNDIGPPSKKTWTPPPNDIGPKNIREYSIRKKEEKEKNSFIEMFPKLYRENPNFEKTWKLFVEQRKESKHPLTKQAVKIIVNKARTQCGANVEAVITGLSNGIEKGYRGVWFPKNSKPETKQTKEEPEKKPYNNPYPVEDDQYAFELDEYENIPGLRGNK